MQNLIFCVNNVVLDTKVMAFFLSLQIFISKTLKIFIYFVWHVFECPDQCLILFGCKPNPNCFKKQNYKQNTTFWFKAKTPIIQFHLMEKMAIIHFHCMEKIVFMGFSYDFLILWN